jgi:ABC-type multidrug transport system ATPase subunit
MVRLDWYVEGIGKWGKYKHYGPVTREQAEAVGSLLKDARVWSQTRKPSALSRGQRRRLT